MTCRLCDRDVPLIEAHIIPRPFFRIYRKDNRAPKVFSNSAGVFPKRVRTGFYDAKILCADCDGRLGVFDDYGSRTFLRDLKDFSPFPTAENPIAFAKHPFNYRKLRLFILSVLWRSGISTLDMFRRVRLGPYESELREMIKQEDPGHSDRFATVLSVFTLGGKLPESGTPIMDPFRERWNGANAYRISFGAITAYVKVDQRAFPESLSRLRVQPDQPLFLIEREFHGSPEASVARAIVKAPQNRNAFRRR